MRPFRITFFTLLIALSAQAAIRVTPETGIVDAVRAPIDGEQSAPIVATDGDQFLVFWLNVRGLYVARVDAEGRLVSSRLALPGPTSELLTATWTGSAYLVTWRDYAKATLFSATFSKTGGLLSGPGAIVAGRVDTFGIATNGHGALLLYRDVAGVPKGLRAAIFDADGRVIRTNVTIPIPDNVYPRISSDGEEFALVWGTEKPEPGPMQDLHLLRMDEEGAAIGSPIDVGSAELTSLAFAFGGGHYAIAAFEGRFVIGSEESRLTRFLVDARRGSVTKLPIVETTNGPANLSMLWSGSAFVLVWSRRPPPSGGVYDLMTLPFSDADESVAPTPVSAWTGWTGNPALSPFSMVSNGHRTLVAWPQDAGLYYGGRRSAIYGSLFHAAVPSAAARGESTLLSVGWSRQFEPSMASSRAGSLIIWIEDGDSTPFFDPGSTSRRLVGMRSDATGAFLDAAPFEIATGVIHAAVAFAGDAYVVAWQKADISAMRTVSGDASPGLLASLGSPISLGPGGYGITAASNGSTALVVFSESRSARLVGYRFDASGRQIDTTPIIAGTNAYAPQAASNGSDFFVAWIPGTNLIFPPANPGDVLGTRITAAGTVDAAPLPIATGPLDEILFAVASDGRDYLVAYQMNPSNGFVIATKRVLREGQLDGTTAAEDGTIIARGAASSVALSGDATGYWIAYAAGSWNGMYLNGNSNVLRLNKRGTPASSAVTFAAGMSTAAVGRLPGGAVRILYSRPVDDGIFAGTTVVFSRFAQDDGIADVGLRGRAARH
jgi:hypothetical protein